MESLYCPECYYLMRISDTTKNITCPQCNLYIVVPTKKTPNPNVGVNDESAPIIVMASLGFILGLVGLILSYFSVLIYKECCFTQDILIKHLFHILWIVIIFIMNLLLLFFSIYLFKLKKKTFSAMVVFGCDFFARLLFTKNKNTAATQYGWLTLTLSMVIILINGLYIFLSQENSIACFLGSIVTIINTFPVIVFSIALIIFVKYPDFTETDVL